MCNESVEDDSISSPILIVMIGALIEYVILKRKEDVIDDENSM